MMAEKDFMQLNSTLVQNLKRKIEALKASESKYRTLLENLPQKIFLKGRDSVYISCNQAYAQDLSIRPEEIKGKTDYDFYPKKLAEKYRADDRRIMKAGKVEEIEENYIQDGRDAFVHTVKVPVKSEKGEVTGVLGIFWDITERKKIEKKLKESEEKFKAVFECSNDGILAADTKTKRFVFANPKICKITGYSAEELLKLNLDDIHPKKDLSYVISCFMKQAQGKMEIAKDIPVLRKDRKVVYCDVNSAPARISGKDLLLGFFRDMTERKQVEDNLREKLKEIDILRKRCREQKACRR
jgi:PAS domain S-box-containing protein